MENLDVKLAIQIARVLVSAQEERLPLVLSVFEKANIDIDGLEELDEWKAINKQTALIDIELFIADLIEGREPTGDEFRIKNSEFNDFCKARSVSARYARKYLYEQGRIRAVMDKGKTSYTVPIEVQKKTERYVVITTK